MTASGPCANHPGEAAITCCSSCRRRLCRQCWRRKVDGTPWCELCIHHLSSRGSAVALAVAFAIIGLGVAAALARWEMKHGAHDEILVICVLVAIGSVLSAAVIGGRQTADHGRRIEARREDEVPSVDPGARVGHPYRSAIFRAARLVASPVSGRWTAAMLLAAMAAVAIAIPWALELPRWIEAEIVLGGWWIGWAGVLTVLLYRGFRLSDDHVLAPPRLPWKSRVDARGKNSPDASGSGCDPGCLDFGSCGEAAFAVVILVAVFAAAWLVVELVLPAMFLLAYLVVRGALARVANDDHECAGHLARALAWGLIWATAYSIPFALAVYAVHRLAAIR